MQNKQNNQHNQSRHSNNCSSDCSNDCNHENSKEVSQEDCSYDYTYIEELLDELQLWLQDNKNVYIDSFFIDRPDDLLTLNKLTGTLTDKLTGKLAQKPTKQTQEHAPQQIPQRIKDKLDTLKIIDQAKIATGMLKGDYKSTSSIFLLKHKYGWSENSHQKNQTSPDNTSDTSETELDIDY